MWDYDKQGKPRPRGKGLGNTLTGMALGQAALGPGGSVIGAGGSDLLEGIGAAFEPPHMETKERKKYPVRVKLPSGATITMYDYAQMDQTMDQGGFLGGGNPLGNALVGAGGTLLGGALLGAPGAAGAAALMNQVLAPTAGTAQGAGVRLPATSVGGPEGIMGNPVAGKTALSPEDIARIVRTVTGRG